MTRIIGGTAGGRRIKVPSGERTRPTSDRVREALFSSLESALGSLEGLRFLDVYAGSGAVGLEALSRGALAVTLVEHDRRAAALIRDNARAARLGDVEVLVVDAVRALAGPPAAPYEVAFLDPPYASPVPEVVAVLRGLHDGGWLSPQALVVVERSRRSPGLRWPDGFVEERTRRYGETVLCYGRATARPAPSG
ncbi:MAG TPA: 16S rRNA (guanine(966)-N(2))-methyltransferase RsmD [Nocardioidaceae bacterium]|nr:16S rRNA (guanine(966)-N(2))-methyltransferase RsmD [Nocardioidaceae bacterium]